MQARSAALENARTDMNVLYLVQKDIVSNIVILKNVIIMSFNLYFCSLIIVMNTPEQKDVKLVSPNQRITYAIDRKKKLVSPNQRKTYSVLNI